MNPIRPVQIYFALFTCFMLLYFVYFPSFYFLYLCFYFALCPAFNCHCSNCPSRRLCTFLCKSNSERGHNQQLKHLVIIFLNITFTASFIVLCLICALSFIQWKLFVSQNWGYMFALTMTIVVSPKTQRVVKV